MNTIQAHRETDVKEIHLVWMTTSFQTYAAACAMHFVEKALAELHVGHNKTWTEFNVPNDAIGYGFQEAVRGVLSRHNVIRNGKIVNDHLYPPPPWNAYPCDAYGTSGPYEDAVQGTPIFEENGPVNFKGIDIMCAVLSFNSCVPCGVPMYVGEGKTVEMHRSPMFDADTVHLAMEGSCDGCLSSSLTTKNRVEKAIDDATPEIRVVLVQGVAEPSDEPKVLVPWGHR